MNAEREARLDLRQGFLGALAAGERVGDNSDMMAAVDLSVGEVEDVAEDSANRSPNSMQDTKRLILAWDNAWLLARILGRWHDQKPTSADAPAIILDSD
jgi:hypothetical protein